MVAQSKITVLYASLHYNINIFEKFQTIGEMSAEQRKVLLFFWTSVKYLPVEGFSGLASRLYIYKSTETHDRLPSSHTCFYRLCFPPYPSFNVLQDRLSVITQEHVGCSFGTLSLAIVNYVNIDPKYECLSQRP